MILIDGHNLIGSGRVPGVSLEQEDDEWRLMQYLRARQSRLRQPVVVVFDGGVPAGAAPELSGGGVQAVFAAAQGSDADRVILARVRQRPAGQKLVVVTNDGALAAAVQALGGQTESAVDFGNRLQAPARGRGPGRRRPGRRARPQAEPKLPKAEVEAWLAEFQQRQTGGEG